MPTLKYHLILCLVCKLSKNSIKSKTQFSITGSRTIPFFSNQVRLPFTELQAMGAKSYMCLLLVILVTSSVHCAGLRRSQDGEKSSLFLYGKLFLGNFGSFL